MSNRDVSNKKIMDSFQGILRISPESLIDSGFPDSGTRVVTDSKGNESSLSLGKYDTQISNNVTLNSINLNGDVKGGSINAEGFTLYSGTDTSILFENIGITFKRGNTSLAQIRGNSFDFSGATSFKNDVDITASASVSFNTSASYKIKDNNGNGEVEMKLSLPTDGQFLYAKEENGKTVLRFRNISDIITEEVQKQMNRLEWKNHTVPVGSIVYITLPSYTCYVIDEDKAKDIISQNGGDASKISQSGINDNSGFGFKFSEAVSVINERLFAAFGSDSYKIIAQSKEFFDDVNETYHEDGTRVSLVDYSSSILCKNQLMDETIKLKSIFELRMPQEYHGYWDFCLGQSEMTYKNNVRYNSTTFQQLYKVMCPFGGAINGNVNFSLPNLQYNFIRCAGQDTYLQGKEWYEGLRDNMSSFYYVEGSGLVLKGQTSDSQEMTLQSGTKVFSQHEEPTTISQDGSAIGGIQQVTDYYDYSKKIVERMSEDTMDGGFGQCVKYMPENVNDKVTGSFTHIDTKKWVKGSAAPEGQWPPGTDRCVYWGGSFGADYPNNHFIMGVYPQLHLNKSPRIQSLISDLSADNSSGLMPSETAPRHSVLIPIIKVLGIGETIQGI